MLDSWPGNTLTDYPVWKSQCDMCALLVKSLQVRCDMRVLLAEDLSRVCVQDGSGCQKNCTPLAPEVRPDLA